jgi:hypothetical protein
MKILKNTLVAVSFATAMLATGAAQAATVSTPNTGTTFAATIVRQEDNSALALTTVAGVNELTITLQAAENLSIDDSVTLTLTGGATWAAIASADLLDDGAPGNFSLANNAVPEVAIFRATAAVAAGSLITLAPTAIVDASAVPSGGSVNIEVLIRGFVGGVATDLYSTPLESLQLQSVELYTSTVATSVTNTIDVVDGYTEFLAGLQTTSTNTTIARNAAGANPGTAGAAVLLTIAGDMTGIASISCTNYTGSTSTGAPTTPVSAANTCAIDTATNTAYGVNTAAVAANANTNIRFTVDGETTLEERVFTVSVTGLEDTVAGYAASTPLVATTLTTLVRNGSSFTSNSLGPLNKVTVTDRSGAIGSGGADGAIAITAYDSDGTAVTCTGLDIPDLTSNGTVTIQGGDLSEACPNAKRIEGVVNSASILSTNTKLTTTGATSQSGVNGTSIAN